MIKKATGQNKRRRLKVIESSTNAQECDRVYGLDYLIVKQDHADEGKQSAQITVFFLGRAPDAFEDKELAEHVRIDGGTRIESVEITSAKLVRKEYSDVDDRLVIQTKWLGDYSEYKLSLIQPAKTNELSKEDDSLDEVEPYEGFDPFYYQLSFNFHQDCSSPPNSFNESNESVASVPKYEEPEINYLAKDYESFRRLILDRLALTMPEWSERHAADIGITVVELLAYVGDHLSYQQDAVATEAYFHTARQRVSVRRHARLIDYHLHEGCNARAWIHVAMLADGNEPKEIEIVPQDIFFTTGGPSPSKRGASDFGSMKTAPSNEHLIFEPIAIAGADDEEKIVLRQHHNVIQFYSWGADEFTLKRGATSATLIDGWLPVAGIETGLENPQPKQESPTSTYDDYSHTQNDGGNKNPDTGYGSSVPNQELPVVEQPERPRKLSLKKGDFLILEEVISPATNNSNDADSSHRQVVRLTSVVETEDDLYGLPVVEITWDKEDALQFDLVVSQLAGPDCSIQEQMSVARGNIILVDHGQTVPDGESLGDVPTKKIESACHDVGQPGEVSYVAGHFRPTLQRTSITFSEPVGVDASATALLHQKAEHALPSIMLESHSEDQKRSVENKEDLRKQLIEAQASWKKFDELCNDENSEPNVNTPQPMLPKSISQLTGSLSCHARTKIRKGTTKDLDLALEELGKIKSQKWTPKLSLLESQKGDQHFVLEVDNNSEATIRFGDGITAQAPTPGDTFKANYRVGNGEIGNVGANSIRHMVFKNNAPGINLKATNPLPALGGVNPESIEEAKRLAPYTARKHFERAVTPDDYAAIIKRDFKDSVQNAAAALVWTGSGHAVHVAVDFLFDSRRSTKASVLTTQMQKHLSRFKRIGHQVVVKEARTIPLKIKLKISVEEQHYWTNVKRDLLSAFRDGKHQLGNVGFFHPDNLSFGTDITASQLISVAQKINGVDGVEVVELARLDKTQMNPDPLPVKSEEENTENGVTGNAEETESGKESGEQDSACVNSTSLAKSVSFGPFEIPRLDNDPNFPEFGIINLESKGGR